MSLYIIKSDFKDIRIEVRVNDFIYDDMREIEMNAIIRIKEFMRENV